MANELSRFSKIEEKKGTFKFSLVRKKLMHSFFWSLLKCLIINWSMSNWVIFLGKKNKSVLFICKFIRCVNVSITNFSYGFQHNSRLCFKLKLISWTFVILFYAIFNLKSFDNPSTNILFDRNVSNSIQIQEFIFKILTGIMRLNECFNSIHKCMLQYCTIMPFQKNSQSIRFLLNFWIDFYVTHICVWHKDFRC